ncbi:hypothetical protein PYW07_007330 [Mythimna separata]|uniref:RNA-directed DNA polymerase n=1 Tax=Mythimna separata TaxID=271217 RepID=A0AAD7Z244_MYTSE|nr:hypothetical protein PYW07_007330 [Mythimna separata]
MANLTLEKFECEGEVTSVCVRWERWKRSLYVYLEAANVTTPSQKRASLLHWGGSELQEIFYNIPDEATTNTSEEASASSEGSVSTDVFKMAIKKLDEYFAPKQSKRFERHVFRLIKQEENEKFEKFVVRLRQQAAKCQFVDVDDQLLDQITDRCSSEELRKKILKNGDKMTLEDVIAEANALEVINRQLEDFSQKQKRNQDVNQVKDNSNNKNQRGKRECFRCGGWNHLAYDEKCPARGRKCTKCGRIGHFKLQCKTNPLKRKPEEDAKQTRNKDTKKFKRPRKDTNNIDEQKNCNSDEEIDYVFNMNNDDIVICKIGGVEVDMLIDSGCKYNLITSKSWSVMKRNKIKVMEQTQNPRKKFYAYGSDSPLKLLGAFKSSIELAGKTQHSIFYVVENGTRNLLGKETALALGVLRIGVAVNEIRSKVFPKFKNVLIHIPIDDKVKPIAQPYRRIPIPLEGKVNAKINELLEKDIIEKVDGPSEWISPIVPILKENGDIRLCIDMRRANSAIKRENHPLPTMDQLLPKIRDAVIFSKLDICDAFHQLELHPDSRSITTFISAKGLYRYKRMMFGISCAPEIFQKTLERILLPCKGVINFIDDILVYGKNRTEHDARLEKVTEVLEANNIILRHEKCILSTNEVEFLGHKLSKQGIRPLDKYLSTIEKFRAPTTVSELQSFMGLINYVGKWIPNLATKTEPLKQLLRNKFGRNADIRELWGESQQASFNSLKVDLADISDLGYYNVQDRTLVFADASPVAIGAVLVQENDSGPRVIAFGNKTLTDCERRYCQTEKEALALVWAVEHFHMFLYGKEFDLVTDHKPLEVIFSPKSKPCARIERWMLRLQSYQYKVIYRPGKNNIADPLSRLCKLTPENSAPNVDYVQNIIEYVRPIAVSLSDIERCSNEDLEIQKVKEGVNERKWDAAVKCYKLIENELCFHEGILLRGTKIVIPKVLRDRVLSAAHEGHPGIVAMKARLRTKVWWPRYDQDVERMVKSCKGCTLVSVPNAPHPLKRRELPSHPWVDIAIDLLGPLPSNDYLLVVVDYYSRYQEIKICRDISSKEMIKLLREVFSRLGYPVSLMADNGKQFVSEQFKSFCKENDIKLYHSVPYWPQQNGEVERQNRSILKRLRICQAENKIHWRESLVDYLTMYNNTPHTVTGKTPAELFFQRKIRDKIPMIDDVEHRNDDMDLRDKDREQKERGREYADRRRKAQDIDLEPGEKVYIKDMNKANKLSTNYEPTQYTVKSRMGGDVEVENDETGQRLRRNIVHLKKVEGEWKVIREDETEGPEREEEH